MKMTPKVVHKYISAIFCLLLLISCNSNEKKVITVYVSADEYIAREVFDAFTKQTGIEVEWVGDTESSKNTSLVQRLLREQRRPIADIFWSSEILGTILLANQGVLMPCKTETSTQWPAEHKDNSFRWFGFSPRARVIAYNPQLIREDELPRTWWEYGGAVMADPRFGTTSTHVAVMAQFPRQCMELFESMKSTPLLGGNAATVQAVVDGRVSFAMTDSDDVHSAIESGHSVAMFMPRHHDSVHGGTLLIPNTVAIIQGCDNPEYAELFVDFLLSNEVATMLAESASHNIPIQKEVASHFPELAVEDPLQVDFYEAADGYDVQLNSVMDVLTQ